MMQVEMSYSVEGRKILDNVRFKAKKGELLVIVGPNGAGKSTLLKCMVGILRGEGRVLFRGTDLLNLRPEKRARILAYVPQSSTPNYDFTVEEFVEMGTYKTSGSIEKALKTVKLWEKRDWSILTLSGGEYQLVLLARALAQGGDVMLLDEPIAHLDVNHVLMIMETLTDLKRGKVIVTVLHDINVALRYADRLLVLKGGRIFWSGTVEEFGEETLEEVYSVKGKIIETEVGKVFVPFSVKL